MTAITAFPDRDFSFGARQLPGRRLVVNAVTMAALAVGVCAAGGLAALSTLHLAGGIAVGLVAPDAASPRIDMTSALLPRLPQAKSDRLWQPETLAKGDSLAPVNRFAQVRPLQPGDVRADGLTASAILASRDKATTVALARSLSATLSEARIAGLLAVNALSRDDQWLGEGRTAAALAYAGLMSPRPDDVTKPDLPTSVALAETVPALPEAAPEAAPLPPDRPIPLARSAPPAPAQTPAQQLALAPPAKTVAEPQPQSRPAAPPVVTAPPPVVAAVPAPKKPQGGGFFASLFGRGTDSARPVTPSTRGGVAVYDISAGVVYMPGGARLEAHSGMGPMRDNPDYVHVKMRGATPPATYKLTMREALFHGVEAIRMTPVDGVAPKGRVGLLAHTYMLRNPGDSNGCLVFRDYRRFLEAFKRGEVRTLVVVPRVTAQTRTQIAGL